MNFTITKTRFLKAILKKIENLIEIEKHFIYSSSYVTVTYTVLSAFKLFKNNNKN